MNLIINKQLDRTQKQLIYELTLKKRQSKKSTMSEKQMAAKQQLARELMLERRIPPIIEETTNLLINHHLSQHEDTLDHITDDQPSTSSSCSIAGTITTTTSSSSLASSVSINQSSQLNRHQINSPPGSSCGCSFGRSDSSYSGSSEDSNSSGSAQMMTDEIARHEDELQALKKQANIKFNKTRLEHLNEELEKRLYQYEYLVTKEKALLDTYNMVLFTNEGVNNFY